MCCHNNIAVGQVGRQLTNWIKFRRRFASRWLTPYYLVRFWVRMSFGLIESELLLHPSCQCPAAGEPQASKSDNGYSLRIASTVKATGSYLGSQIRNRWYSLVDTADPSSWTRGFHKQKVAKLLRRADKQIYCRYIRVFTKIPKRKVQMP